MAGSLKCIYATGTHAWRSSLNCFHHFLLQWNHRQPLHDFSPWKCISGTVQWNLDPVSISSFTLASPWILSEAIVLVFPAKKCVWVLQKHASVHCVTGRISCSWVWPCGVIVYRPLTDWDDKNCIFSMAGAGHLFWEGSGRLYTLHCLIATATEKQKRSNAYRSLCHN